MILVVVFFLRAEHATYDLQSRYTFNLNFKDYSGLSSR